MPTGLILGGLYLGGKVIEGIGAGQVADANVEAEKIRAAQQQAALDTSTTTLQQAQEQQRQDVMQGQQQGLNYLQGGENAAFDQFSALNNLGGQFSQNALDAQGAQSALLGMGGDAAAQAQAQGLLNSPLVQAITAQNERATNARASAAGVGGGNVLRGLQDLNTSTILQAGLGGLQSLSSQGMQGGLGFGGLANQALGQGLGVQANQANIATGGAAQLGQGALSMGLNLGNNQLNQGNLMGNTMANQTMAQGTANALPWLSAGQTLGGLSNMAGGFGGLNSFAPQQGTNMPTNVQQYTQAQQPGMVQSALNFLGNL